MFCSSHGHLDSWVFWCLIDAKIKKLCRASPRRTFLHCACLENHLRGITGPGAPHSFAFDRRGDLPGALSDQNVLILWVLKVLFSKPSLSCGWVLVTGEIQDSIPRSRFWEAYKFDASDDDVIMRSLGCKGSIIFFVAHCCETFVSAWILAFDLSWTIHRENNAIKMSFNFPILFCMVWALVYVFVVLNCLCFCSSGIIRLRTKQNMSDERFGTPLLYLPAALCVHIRNSGMIPEGRRRV